MTGNPPLIGIVGWKNSGKTTLCVHLIEEFSRRGYRVASVKHAHHSFQIDDADTDSARHRRAGAAQVAIVSASRWAIVTELGQQAEPNLTEVIARLAPCDLVIVEGYKTAPIAKIEVRRRAAHEHTPLAATDHNIVAIAADHAIDGSVLPVFGLDEIERLADFIAAQVGMGAARAGA